LIPSALAAQLEQGLRDFLLASFSSTTPGFDLGADLRRRPKPDRFREVGFGSAVRIDRERVAFAT
jgi:hypothetical protein